MEIILFSRAAVPLDVAQAGEGRRNSQNLSAVGSQLLETTMKANLNSITAPKSILSITILAMFGAAATASALTIDTVTIGNPGNPNDPFTGNLYGGVSATYNIGKYEVTLNQYTEFLNAVADTDAFGLYSTKMGTDLNIKGITRAGSSGSYTYSVFGDGQRPVTFVSWFDAARFTNWLHNGQPNTGSQTAGTTEQGAYALNGAISGVGFSKGVGAQYWIPSENEWYKAAYYQPAAAGGDTDGYWLYPTKTNTALTNNTPGAGTSRGNFFDGDLATTQSDSYDSAQNYLTAVGAYTDSASYYGTYDQGGNVVEWNDKIIDGSLRGHRGGSWNRYEDILRASSPGGDGPTAENRVVGFRVATVPEPTVSVSLMLAGGLLLSRRKRPSAL